MKAQKVIGRLLPAIHPIALVKVMVPTGVRKSLRKLQAFLRIMLVKHVHGARFARFNMDKKLEKYLDYENGYYVELGANDGIKASNTYFLEKTKGWTGILIEPSPNLFLKCVKERGLNNQVFCNACVSFGFSEKFVEMIYSDSMTLGKDLDSDISDSEGHAKQGEKHLTEGEVIFLFGAVAKTLNEILLETDAPKSIDFISLDVEGAELEVLKGIDFKHFSIKYLLIECRDIQRIDKYLARSGYKNLGLLSHHDYLFGLIE